jgi:tRNA A37 threonylcarbamoyladenosine synthetase subunit TsaC/SUA5/YrdC
MGAPDIKADARRVFDVLKAGGIAITPSSMGYALATATTEALEKMFTTKRRSAHKRHAMGGNYELHKQLHVMQPEHAEVVRCLTQDFDLPLAVIAKYDPNHPMLKHIDQSTLEALTVNGTLAMLINAGAFQDELIDLMIEANIPVIGSSANISGTGKFIQFLFSQI